MVIITRTEAAKLLSQNEIVAVPTETVYGLAGIATNSIAIEKIFSIKQRPKNRPLIVHYGTQPLWLNDCRWNQDAEKLAQAFWPGPLTMILPRHQNSQLCNKVSTSTIALRRSIHPDMIWLCDQCGPLAAPSANKYQKLSTTTAVDTQQALSEIPVAIDTISFTSPRIESTIIDLTVKPYCIRRLGGILPEELQQFVECRIYASDHSPGSGKHYQPHKPLRLNATDINTNEALLSFGTHKLSAHWEENLSRDGNTEEAAANFYQMLWKLSNTKCTGIAVMPIPQEGLGVVLNDKLQKATL